MSNFIVKKVAVLGAGVMGAQIAAHCINARVPVVLFDLPAKEGPKNGIVQRAIENLKKLSPAPLGNKDDAALIQVANYEDDLAVLEGCDLIIEAVFESRDLKAKVTQEAEPQLAPGGFFASNTSTLPIGGLATASGRPEKFVGIHFFSPVDKMKLVEIVRGLATSDETVQRTIELAERMGKTPIPANDRAGFVSNRVLMPLINEAFFAWMEGVAEPEAIDEIMKLGCNFPMGPLRLADFIGLDVCHDIMMVLYRELGDQKFFPCPLLRQLVTAGRLGDKSGHGVYEH